MSVEAVWQPPAAEECLCTQLTSLRLLWSACLFVIFFCLDFLTSLWLPKPYIIFLSPSHQLPISFPVWSETPYLLSTAGLWSSLSAPCCLCCISAMELLNCTRVRAKLTGRVHPVKPILQAKITKSRRSFPTIGGHMDDHCHLVENMDQGYTSHPTVALHNGEGSEQPPEFCVFLQQLLRTIP